MAKRALPPAAPPKPTPPKIWTASIHLGHTDKLPDALVDGVAELEKELNLAIVVLIQQGIEDKGKTLPFEMLDLDVVRGLRRFARDHAKSKPLGLLIDSPGGYAREAFSLARILHKHCGGFTAIVPQYAKSAATLLTLGADRILMHQDAELGPIDAQVMDPERERRGSALDEVQSLERLHAQALDLVDSTMYLLIQRTHKRTDVLLPLVLNYVSQTMRPLFEKIDTVHFTGMSRTLKVAEAYAERLVARWNPDSAKFVAQKLVYDYPAHDFVIDYVEAKRLALNVEKLKGRAATVAEAIREHLNDFTAIGQIVEAKPHVP